MVASSRELCYNEKAVMMMAYQLSTMVRCHRTRTLEERE
jgi:hypothetical protein